MDATPPAPSSRGTELDPRPWYGRARLAARTAKFGARSARAGEWDFAGNAVRSIADVTAQSVRDGVRPDEVVVCNLCGWSGRRFYRNTGPGYDERDSLCAGCLTPDRYRTLFEVLRRRTSVFEPGVRVIEVAPLISMEQIFVSRPEVDYTSFDIERHAMEVGDITAMRYPDASADWFICFHVLEHIPDEPAALAEIHRVLRPGGQAVLQVPVDWHVDATREYGAPDPRDVGHVRRHGRDFADRITAAGFEVTRVDVADLVDAAYIRRHGLSTEPIFLARVPG